MSRTCPAREEGGGRLRSALLGIWYNGSDRPAWAPFLEVFLRLLESVYRLWLGMVDGAYGRGWRQARRVNRPVISVGNLTVGGSGKSTLCLKLAGKIETWGHRAALVSHFYGGRRRQEGTLMFRGRDGSVPDWSEVGDEASMMAMANQNLLVVGGADKAVSLLAAADTDAEVIILDDAFHRRDIHRDLDLVLIDSRRGFGNGHCLPRGPLREPPAALARADAFIVGVPSGGKLPEEISDLLMSVNPGVPVITAVKVPSGLETWPQRRKLEVSHLRGRRVYAFCGLGNPEGFLESLAGTGAEIAGQAVFPDHHPYSPGDIARIERESAALEAQALVTTAKDAVKIAAWPAEAPPLLVLHAKFSLNDPQKWLDAKLHSLLQ